MAMATNIKRIGFIGLGVMGRSMARNLLKAGYSLAVHTRTKATADELLQEGARWADTPAKAAVDADLVISMVGFPADVEEVYFGESGVLSTMRGGFIADMTTSSPTLARRLHEAAGKLGVAALDAPVSGGDIGARDATLVIMVGGDRAAFEAARPVFESLGRTVRHFGDAGAGQHTKMANQIAIASNMMGVCEAVAYATRAGLNVAEVIATIGGGAAGSWSLSNLAPRMIRHDTAPGFYVKHFLKDMRIALESAAEMHLQLPGLELAKKLYDRLSSEGGDSFGTQALIKLYLGGN